MFKNTLANDFIRLRRLARQCNKICDHDGLDEIGLYLGQSLSSFETYFSDHEFAQLIGANFKQVEKLRWEYDADGSELLTTFPEEFQEDLDKKYGKVEQV